MKDRFDLIIFDWDGTLINSIDWIVHCLQHAAFTCKCEVPSEQEAKNVIGLSLKKAMSRLFPETEQDIQQQLAASYSKHYLSKPIKPEDLFDGVYDMLVDLKGAGYQLAVATGKTRTGLDKALKATGTENLFSFTRCADETASKPSPLMIHQIIQQLDAANERTVMIGDSVHDMQMAANAEISSVAVSSGTHSSKTLQQFNPLLCLNHITELQELL